MIGGLDDAGSGDEGQGSAGTDENVADLDGAGRHGVRAGMLPRGESVRKRVGLVGIVDCSGWSAGAGSVGCRRNLPGEWRGNGWGGGQPSPVAVRRWSRQMRGLVETEERADAADAAQRVDCCVVDHETEGGARRVGQPGLDEAGDGGAVADEDDSVVVGGPAGAEIGDEALLADDEVGKGFDEGRPVGGGVVGIADDAWEPTGEIAGGREGEADEVEGGAAVKLGQFAADSDGQMQGRGHGLGGLNGPAIGAGIDGGDAKRGQSAGEGVGLAAAEVREVGVGMSVFTGVVAGFGVTAGEGEHRGERLPEIGNAVGAGASNSGVIIAGGRGER